jgi:acetolactate synthase-1/3 small subunit
MPDITYTLILSVRDAPGVLVRVAQIFARRSCNISAIHVTHPSDSPASEMVITVRNVARIDQIASQLEKLIDVYNVNVKQQIQGDRSQ